jgi:hypothetical protein
MWDRTVVEMGRLNLLSHQESGWRDGSTRRPALYEENHHHKHNNNVQISFTMYTVHYGADFYRTSFFHADTVRGWRNVLGLEFWHKYDEDIKF